MPRFVTMIFSLLLAACDWAAVQQKTVPSPHELAGRGDTQRLLQAISDHSGVDQRDVCYRTPLMLAAQHGHLGTVSELLARAARVDMHDGSYYTALMLAAGSGHAEVVRRLIAAGANVDAVEITRGWTALIWAAKRGHLETVRLLIARGADPAIRDAQGRSAADWARAGGHAGIAALL